MFNCPWWRETTRARWLHSTPCRLLDRVLWFDLPSERSSMKSSLLSIPPTIYREYADEYKELARSTSDELLRALYLKMATMWEHAALRFENGGLTSERAIRSFSVGWLEASRTISALAFARAASSSEGRTLTNADARRKKAD